MLSRRLIVRTKKTGDIRLHHLSANKVGNAIWAHYESIAREMNYLGVASSVSRATESEVTIHFVDDHLEVV